MRRYAFALVLLALAPVVGGCPPFTSSDDACNACTELYALVTVRIVDAEGRPVEGLTVTSTNLRTSEVLQLEDASAFGEGVYAVATDLHVNRVREAGDTIRFRASSRGLVAEGDFVVGTDDCACHVEKRSGPDTLTARPE